MRKIGPFLAQLAQPSGAAWLLFAAVSPLACGNDAAKSSEVSGRELNLCPGTVAPPEGSTPCRDACAVGQICILQAPPTPAIYCGPTGTQCTVDSDCGDAGDQICQAFTCTTTFHQCAQSCAVGGCGAGYVCGSDGRCSAIPCGADYSCPADFVCAPSRPAPTTVSSYMTSDPHGCSPATCDTDGYACIASGTECNPQTGDDAHGCNPPRCDQGGSCPVDSRCDPANATSKDGCALLPCASDTDCPCGLCVAGACTRQPGYCSAFGGLL